MCFPEKDAVNFTFVFIFFYNAFFFFTQGNSFAQRTPAASNNASVLNTSITLSLTNQPIQKIIDTLSSYENVKFSYVNHELPLQKKVSIHVSNQPLKVVLDSVFINQGIQYFVVSKQIVLKKEDKPTVLKKDILTNTLFSHWYVSFFLGGGSSYRTLQSKDGSLLMSKNMAEKSKADFTGGAHLTLLLSSGLSFRTGLVLLNTGEKGSYSYSVKDSSIVTTGNGNGNNGNGNGNNGKGNVAVKTSTMGTVSYVNAYHYLSFPLLVGYSIQKNKFIFSAFSGAGISFLLGNSTKYPGSSESTLYTTSSYSTVSNYKCKKMLVTLPVMIEAMYRISDQIGITGAFSFTYFASSIYTSAAPIENRPYNRSALLGVAYFPGRK